jgi:hypothetical protein
MKARRSLISRIASAFRKPKPKVKARKTVKESKHRGIESLEGRIAPATLIDASTIQFKDIGGDLITIHFSKPLFTLGDTIEQTVTLNNLDNIFKFSAGTFATDVEQDLRLLDLTKVKLAGDPPKNPANGISFTIEAETPAGGAGDGLVKVGQIQATGMTLGHVSIDGDLGQIDAGKASPSTKIAIKSLTINSLYANGATTQLGSVSATDALESRIVGGVGLLHVTGDLFGYFHVLDGSSLVGPDNNPTLKVTAPGNLAKVIVDGSVRGDFTPTSTDNLGSISAQGEIGSVQVLGVGDGSGAKGLIGGAGRNNGTIVSQKNIGSVFIADSLTGGDGLNSGAVIAGRTLNKITVENDVAGGEGALSGSIQGATIKYASIGDSLIGNEGDNSGTIISSGKATKIEITNDITGGLGKFSGNIRVSEIGSVTIGGSVTGAAGADSGVVFATRGIKSVEIGEDIVGGNGIGSGGVLANGVVQSVVVNGDVTGGVASNTGYIGSQSKIVSAKVMGSLIGGEGDLSGRVFSAGSIDKISAAKLVGGIGFGSGSILAATDLATGGSIKSVVIEQGLEGGAGQSSGTIMSGDDIGKVTIGSRIIPANVIGGEGKFSGSIIAQDSIGKAGTGVLVYGSVTGGAGDQSGLIEAGGDAALIEIRGGLSGLDGNEGEQSGIVRVKGQLKALEVDGGLNNALVLVGADLVKATIGTGITDSLISALGAVDPKPKAGDIAIGSIIVNGSVSGSQILAGYDLDGTPTNADASIKSVRVTGNWSASDLIAGVIATNGEFGDSDDIRIPGGIDRDGFVATIAKVQILGSVTGSAEPTEHFGFVAEQIDSLEIGGSDLAFTTAPGQVIEIQGTTNVTAREVTT